MRVVFLSDLEALGGAGLSASRLAAGLADDGIEVSRLYNNPDRTPHLERYAQESRYIGPVRSTQILINGARRLAPKLANRVAARISGRMLREVLARHEFDLLHIHSVANCDWNHRALTSIDPSIPTVWTFHDCWSFSSESQCYQDLEGKQIRLRPDGEDREAAISTRRRYFESRKSLRLIANSEFTASEARRILVHPVDVILPGVPLTRFGPVDKSAARNSLHLDGDRFVIAFVADNRSDPLKGFEVLRRALDNIDAPIDVLLAGDGATNIKPGGRTRFHIYGRLLAPELLSIVYSAADMLALPSLAEALGMVAMESIACGTPVVGSNVGGIPEVVRPGLTGWLVPSGDPAAWRAQIEYLIANRKQLAVIGTNCVDYAALNWSIATHTRRHVEIYRALLGT